MMEIILKNELFQMFLKFFDASYTYLIKFSMNLEKNKRKFRKMLKIALCYWHEYASNFKIIDNCHRQVLYFVFQIELFYV